MAFRIRGGMHEKLIASAKARDVSLSEEIESRLGRSYDMEEQIKDTQAIDLLLWPDAEARALGRAFAMTLAAARHAKGQGWREDPAVPLVVAGAVRRLLDRCIRDGGTLLAGLAVDPVRAAAIADGIAKIVGPALDEAMPPLTERAFDVMQWTGRVSLVTEFRKAGTAEVLETVTGPDCDVTDPASRPEHGDGCRAALARFAPIRDQVDVETFTAYALRDGTTARVSLDFTPAGPERQPAPQTPTRPHKPAPLPDGLRYAISDELAEMKPDRGQLPPEIGDRSLFDGAVAELPLVQAERAAEAKRQSKAPLDVGTVPAEAVPAPKRGRPRKAPA